MCIRFGLCCVCLRIEDCGDSHWQLDFAGSFVYQCLQWMQWIGCKSKCVMCLLRKSGHFRGENGVSSFKGLKYIISKRKISHFQQNSEILQKVLRRNHPLWARLALALFPVHVVRPPAGFVTPHFCLVTREDTWASNLSATTLPCPTSALPGGFYAWECCLVAWSWLDWSTKREKQQVKGITLKAAGSWRYS